MKIRKLMGTAMVAVLLLPASMSVAAETYSSKSLHLKNVTGTVNVRTTNGSKIEVDINNGAGVIAAPTVAVKNGVVVITGEKFRNSNCEHRGMNGRNAEYGRDVEKRNKFVFLGVRNTKNDRLTKKDLRPLADYPSLSISVPKGTAVEIGGGYVFGEVGDVGEADIQVNGCGGFAVGDVAGDLHAQVNGSGDFFGSNVGGELNGQVNGSGDMLIEKVAGFARTQVNGSGDLAVGKVSDGLNAQVNGSGDVMIESVSGSVVSQVNGSGDIGIEGGEASSLHAQIVGSGDITFNGHANGVTGQVIGSGDVMVASYDGEMRITKPGKRGHHGKNSWRQHKEDRHSDDD